MISKKENIKHNKFYLTTPIFYVNAKPHMGHAYAAVLADIIARYQRLSLKETYFLTGTDEHGAKIARAAEAAAKEPRVFVDEMAEEFQGLFSVLNISHDQFIRTSDRERHWPGAVKLWQKMMEKGDLSKRLYRGLYCVGCEAFITEKDLMEGKCVYHAKEPEVVEEENYFFHLSKYAKEIERAIEGDEMRILPTTRKNEILAFIKEGLEDVSFSRPSKDISWGVPVPDDPSQTMYVWCDALSNYLSALGYGSDDESLFQKLWPADLHVLGKDILRFHAAIWPGMLMSAGLSLPKTLMVHGLILSGGRKMSKSIGNVVDPLKIIEEYGVDAFRYYLSREINPFEDGDFTEERFNEAYNANLANGLGNLVSRIMKMSQNYLDAPHPLGCGASRLSPWTEYQKLMNGFEVNKAADLVWQKIGDLDRKIQETEPYKLVKTDQEKAKMIIAELVDELFGIAIRLEPFMPETARKIKASIQANKMPAPLFVRKI